MTATVQLARATEVPAAKAMSARLWIVVSTFVIVLLLAVFWRARRDLIVQAIHPYRVTRINTAEATMNLTHGNHSYVVACGQHCGDFQSGGFYRMDDAGAVLQYTRGGQTISLPIIQEEITFDVTGGRG